MISLRRQFIQSAEPPNITLRAKPYRCITWRKPFQTKCSRKIIVFFIVVLSIPELRRRFQPIPQRNQGDANQSGIGRYIRCGDLDKEVR
ncbi:hypothetical protein SEUCBS140593_009665 [Sporothrix eucalyptigena]|uniref:Uncharacterized protein n=1 Tax=Sporothrix eucalyptigena TaxID=1812306 RepID=A0ABP0CWX2_9PEZI